MFLLGTLNRMAYALLCILDICLKANVCSRLDIGAYWIKSFAC